MADPLNQFFDEAGSIVNKLLPNNPGQGIKIKPGSGVWRTNISGGVSDSSQGGFGRKKRDKGEKTGESNLDATLNKVSFTKLESKNKDGEDYPISYGSTPMEYYRTTKSGGYPEYYVIPNPEFLRNTKTYYQEIGLGSRISPLDDPSAQFREGQNMDPIARGTLDTDETSLYFQPNFKYTSWNNNSEKAGGLLTPVDNEDPVYFGFEIEIDVASSPLLNGELEKFVKSIEYSEVTSRLDLVTEFKKQFVRIFRTSATVEDHNGVDIKSATQSLFGLDPDNKRYYYINKISGLQKLNEQNTPGKNSQFVAYNTDLITLTFFEDTTLNLGTLYSLYKLIYWSRLRGKSIIPENLLRFDCKIIVSELRNFVQVQKIIKTIDDSTRLIQAQSDSQYKIYEVLEANLSRYVYNLYECQFFFDKPTHPDSIDMGGNLSSTPTYDMTFNFKYSNMTFERFKYNPSDANFVGGYIQLTNAFENPNTEYQNSTLIAKNKDVSSSVSFYPLDETSSLKPTEKKQAEKNSGTDVVQSKREIRKANRASRKKGKQEGTQSTAIPEAKAQNLSGVAVKLEKLRVQRENLTIVEEKRDSFFREIGFEFLNNIKSAGLREAQRQINYQFLFINNSLDKIRNSFGIGRMAPPTNVYEGGATYNRTFINDVMGSVRRFAGRGLTQLISPIGR